ELTEKLKKYGFEEMLNWYKNRYNSIFGEQDSSYDIAKEMCEDVGLSIGKVKTYLLSIGYTGYSSIEGIKWTSTNIDSKHYPILEIKVYEFLKDKNIEEYVDEFWKLKNLEENLDSSENALSKLKAEDLWDSI
ncbi:MAG: hypothetical protein L0K85_04875, partial [Staphylococcus simulans]|nr:hypothetical protein [Staphylococcus simulans]